MKSPLLKLLLIQIQLFRGETSIKAFHPYTVSLAPQPVKPVSFVLTAIGVREGVSGVSGDTPGCRTGNGVGLETSGKKKKFETQ